MEEKSILNNEIKGLLDEWKSIMLNFHELEISLRNPQDSHDSLFIKFIEKYLGEVSKQSTRIEPNDNGGGSNIFRKYIIHILNAKNPNGNPIQPIKKTICGYFKRIETRINALIEKNQDEKNQDQEKLVAIHNAILKHCELNNKNLYRHLTLNTIILYTDDKYKNINIYLDNMMLELNSVYIAYVPEFKEIIQDVIQKFQKLDPSLNSKRKHEKSKGDEGDGESMEQIIKKIKDNDGEQVIKRPILKIKDDNNEERQDDNNEEQQDGENFIIKIPILKKKDTNNDEEVKKYIEKYIQYKKLLYKEDPRYLLENFDKDINDIAQTAFIKKNFHKDLFDNMVNLYFDKNWPKLIGGYTDNQIKARIHIIKIFLKDKGINIKVSIETIIKIFKNDLSFVNVLNDVIYVLSYRDNKFIKSNEDHIKIGNLEKKYQNKYKSLELDQNANEYLLLFFEIIVKKERPQILDPDQLGIGQKNALINPDFEEKTIKIEDGEDNNQYIINIDGKKFEVNNGQMVLQNRHLNGDTGQQINPNDGGIIVKMEEESGESGESEKNGINCNCTQISNNKILHMEIKINGIDFVLHSKDEYEMQQRHLNGDVGEQYWY